LSLVCVEKRSSRGSREEVAMGILSAKNAEKWRDKSHNNKIVEK
jgi:hypothetical protein